MASDNSIVFQKSALIAVAAAISPLAILAIMRRRQSFRVQSKSNDGANKKQIIAGGYKSLIGNTPLVYLPHLSSLLNNNVRIYVKMENINPGGTGKDRAASSMILAAEKRGELPPPSKNGKKVTSSTCQHLGNKFNDTSYKDTKCNNNNPTNNNSFANIPPNIHAAILTALNNSETNGIIIEGTSGSTGISLASVASSRGHGVIVVMPDDQSSQKREFLERLGCGVVVVKNCSISNSGHYVNVARRIWKWVELERRYDEYCWNSLRGIVRKGMAMQLQSRTFQNRSMLHL